MPFTSRVFRIFIASPSDVVEERDIVERTINDWNVRHSKVRNIVLLPVRWESHTTPEYGTRAQEAINRQIVDDCDAVVAMFWTRLGSHTGVAESGTIEEIERVAAEGKDVLVYFSSVAVPPDRIEVEQLDRLRHFRARIRANTLYTEYRSFADFTAYFSRHLDRLVQNLENADQQDDPISIEVKVNNALLAKDGTQAIEVDYPAFPNGLSDFRKMDILQPCVTHLSMSKSVAIKLTNPHSHSLSNVHIDLTIQAEKFMVSHFRESRNALVRRWDQFVDAQPRNFGSLWFRENLTIAYDLPAIQPKRVVSLTPSICIGGQEQAIEIELKIYSDSFHDPMNWKAKLLLTNTSVSAEIAELIRKRLANEINVESFETELANQIPF